ncbi:carboxypeptidase regulatory-like domain-containing protein [Granulicella cerasi]|uniref:Carboxypeptidase regulatory-like domain-containing protein n=1 Tax=Granulicella cerasi TaxID=741063 RepID=A0ABW1Z513_9BACT|nr:carboxypeptidase regulatory-like domain-containing protein [Granulicella cerasi]
MAKLLVLAVAILLSRAVLAQSDQGAVTGTVMDPQGAVVSGASVQLTQVDTGLVLTAKTNQGGVYVFSPIKIGNYSIKISHEGFQTVEKTALHLNVNQRLGVDVKLPIGSANDVVNVVGTTELETEDSSVSQVVSSKTLNETPLNGRNYIFIAHLSAGVAPSPGTRGTGKGDFSANGQRAEQNDFILDGVDNNSNVVDFLNGASFVVKPPPDALAEFKLQTSSFDASFGHSAGAVINASIKSGTNQFHGDLWEYWRNDALNARNWDALTIPKFRQNQFGATIGGPIIPNRLFFFADGEANRIIYGQTFTGTVPTALMRQGNFTELLNPAINGQGQAITLYQPNSGGTTLLTCNGQQNVLCPTQINATAQRLLNLFPAPNANGANIYNNYKKNLNVADNTAQWDGRLDWNATAKDQAFARMSYSNEPVTYPPPLGSILDGGTFANTGSGLSRGENFVFSETHIFSPNFVNEFRFGYNWGHFAYKNATANTDVSAQEGIGGIPYSPGIGGLPYMVVSGINQIGAPANYPSDEYQNSYQILDNVTRVVGRHNLRFGVNFQRIRFSTEQPGFVRGYFGYDGTYTGKPGVSYTGYGVADLLTDQTRNAQITQLAVTDDVRWYRSAYVQDDWKATPALTINAGIRYDYYQPYVDRHDNQANINVTSSGNGTGSAQFLLPKNSKAVLPAAFLANAAANNISIVRTDNRGLVNAQKLNFAPRIGFALKTSDRSVVRGAYGLFYGGLESIGYAGNLGANFPFNVTVGVNTPTCVAGSCPNNGINLETGFSAITQNGIANYANGIIGFNALAQNVKTPYTQQFNASFEYALTHTMSATVSYVGSAGHHLQSYTNANSARVITAPGVNTLPFQPFPAFGGILYTSFGSDSNYNSLQAKLEKRTDIGLSFLATYTYSHSLDDAPTPLNNFCCGNTYFNPIQHSYGSSEFDVRQRVTLNGSYDLPVGKGRKYLNSSRLVDETIGGWSTALTLSAQTGVPFTVGDNVISPNGSSAHAILVRDPFKPGGSPDPTNPNITCPTRVRTVQHWYNPCAFANPLSATQGGLTGTATISDYNAAQKFNVVGRNNISGPGYDKINVSLFKNFPTFGSQYLQFRGDAFNVFNTPAYSNPADTGINTTSSYINSVKSLGQYTPDARFFQLAAKYYF